MPTLTKSPEATSASSSAPLPPRRASLFSQYALSQTPEGQAGEYGGVLLKPWMPRAGGWREDELQQPGTVVPAEVTKMWPLPNRLAMERGGYISFFQSFAEAEHSGALVAKVQENPIRARVEAANDRIAKMNAARARRRLERMGLVAPAA